MIYDPYYCQGSTVARLASLGFPRVYNRKEDFYEARLGRCRLYRQFVGTKRTMYRLCTACFLVSTGVPTTAVNFL